MPPGRATNCNYDRKCAAVINPNKLLSEPMRPHGLLSLSKKSMWDFFDCACERVFCRMAKYDTRKSLKSAFSDARRSNSRRALPPRAPLPLCFGSLCFVF